MLQRVKRSSKRNYYITQCTKFKNNCKLLWKTINNAIKKSSVIDNIKVNNITQVDPIKISNAFGEHFATVGSKISIKGRKSKHKIDHYLNKIVPQEKSVFLTPCTKEEIKKLINELPNKSSSGHDEITNTLLKELSDQILDPLTYIFNLSLSEGTFPTEMKIADVSPLFKGGNKQLLDNYRPISLLPTISKILEKIMYTHIYQFLDQNHTFFKSQYGFRKKHSCEHAVTELIGEICKGLENSKETLALFIDLSKAFDTINHDILFKKLERYGIRGVVLKWFKSYLKDRNIRAKCNCSGSSHITYSKEFKVNTGTPQGSCLGPLIFLIFCNDLYLNLKLCNGILFADDTTIYKSHENRNYLMWCVKHDLEILSDWFKANHLRLNSSKSVGILFSGKKSSSPPDIEFNGVKLKIVNTIKKLQKLQNKCIMLINGQKPSNKNYKSLRILKILELVKLENYKFGYKFVNKTLPPRILELTKHDHLGRNLVKSHSYNTRKKNLLNKPKANNKLYRSSVLYKGIGAIESLKAETLNQKNNLLICISM